jgi:ribosomal protein L11 methyltransferase
VPFRGDRALSGEDLAAGAAAPILIGGRFRICAAGRAGDPEGRRIDLHLSPGAFGSGEHETTASCLEALESLEAIAGANVLDLGSGTGILAIAAVKLGAARAVCVDTSERAVEAARRNCERNGVADRVRHVRGELADVGDEAFDLVLANLWAEILQGVAPRLAAMTKEGGRLVLSGILWEDAWDVRRRFESVGCVAVRTRMLESYCTMVLDRVSGRGEAG